MKRTNNYLIMRDQAKSYFLNFDQQMLAERWNLPMDNQTLYVSFFEQPYRIVCQGKAAEAGCVFRLVLLHDLRDPGHGVPYGQRLHRKVDAVPFQPQYPLRRRPHSAVT